VVFEVTSFKYDADSDRKPLSQDKKNNIATVILMGKARERQDESKTNEAPSSQSSPQSSLVRISQFFEPAPQDKIKFEISAISNAKINSSLSGAFEKGDFSLLLRRACACTNLPVVKILLINKQALKIDINQKSSNGNSALDWVRGAQADKQDISAIELLLSEHRIQQTEYLSFDKTQSL